MLICRPMKFNTQRTDICMEQVIDFNHPHTTLEEFENGGFILKMHQMLSVHTTSKELKKRNNRCHFGLLFKETSVWEIACSS